MKEMICKTWVFKGTGLWIAASLLLFTACGGSEKKTVMDTPTSGHIKMESDDSYQLLTDAELFTFESLYADAKIDPFYKNETDIFNDFLKDSVRCIIVNRQLTKNEEQFLNSQQIIPRSLKIAYDAIALIVNRKNPDTNFFFDRIADIFKGKISRWDQIHPGSKLGEISVVFDNFKSGNPRYFREKFNMDKLPGNCYAVNNNDEVINFVEKHMNVIGVISVNWISDKADTVSQHFLQKITVAGISSPGTIDPNTSFYRPYQAYIKLGTYPFTREVYCINRETYAGLGYGFTSFVAGPQGQLIVLHSGLVPATMPVRIVEIKH